MDDIELLAQYAQHNSEEAFATLVARHVNLVYSVAMRHVSNPHQAEEITQAVFIILAKEARGLSKRTVLSGWLYQTARLTAANFLRTEIRRTHREQEAYMQSILNETESDAWPQIAPLLDTAMAGLGEKDRNAIVLRFLESKNFRDVGTALSASEDAAKMRVNRAVEKLRKFFTKHGVTLSAAAIATTVSANSIQAAPIALKISAVAAAKGLTVTASTLTLVKGTMKVMTWMKLKFAFSIGTAVLLTGGVVAIALPKSNADNKLAARTSEKLPAKPDTLPANPKMENQTRRNISSPLTNNDTDSLSATNILAAVQQTYASLSTYRDTGLTVHRWGDAVWTNAFSLRLGRTNYYLVELAEQHPRSYTNVFVYWSAGDGDYASHAMHMNPLLVKESSRKSSDLAGNLSLTTHNTIVPTVFFNLSWGNYLSYLTISWRTSVSRQPDEKVGDVDCYVLGQTNSNPQLTLWVGKQDFLIRCFQRFSTREATIESMKRSSNQSPLQPQDVKDQTTIEIHENISVNEPLNKEEFIHEVPATSKPPKAVP